ncbi:hypothetical protein [Pedobacter sp. AJM]|uniref:hypothetical protein n=1 Tax=Pedobacter sp. AJM TaxID=2003629 RepID=UPI000B4AA457|nr:hypothetical protein [Pedobacter sp. AJM]OWK69225.1 hypothetical protein CBW18_18210 [Pedobacter sp. AJM]
MIDVVTVQDSRYSGNMVIMLRKAVITVYIEASIRLKPVHSKHKRPPEISGSRLILLKIKKTG